MEQLISDFWSEYGLLTLILILGTPSLVLFFEWITRPVNPRQRANRKIMKLLAMRVKNEPDSRFGQILRNSGVVVEVGIKDSADEEWETPDYYWARGIHEEPFITLLRMEKDARGEYEETKVFTRIKK